LLMKQPCLEAFPMLWEIQLCMCRETISVKGLHICIECGV
jgi:hypothetical protein